MTGQAEPMQEDNGAFSGSVAIVTDGQLHAIACRHGDVRAGSADAAPRGHGMAHQLSRRGLGVGRLSRGARYLERAVAHHALRRDVLVRTEIAVLSTSRSAV